MLSIVAEIFALNSAIIALIFCGSDGGDLAKLLNMPSTESNSSIPTSEEALPSAAEATDEARYSPIGYKYLQTATT